MSAQAISEGSRSCRNRTAHRSRSAARAGEVRDDTAAVRRSLIGSTGGSTRALPDMVLRASAREKCAGCSRWPASGGATAPAIGTTGEGRPTRGAPVGRPRPNNSLPRSRSTQTQRNPARGVSGRRQKLEQRWDRGIGSGTLARGGLDQRIPVSMEKSTWLKRPGRTRACSGWSPRPMGGCAVRDTV